MQRTTRYNNAHAQHTGCHTYSTKWVGLSSSQRQKVVRRCAELLEVLRRLPDQPDRLCRPCYDGHGHIVEAIEISIILQCCTSSVLGMVCHWFGRGILVRADFCGCCSWDDIDSEVTVLLVGGVDWAFTFFSCCRWHSSFLQRSKRNFAPFLLRLWNPFPLSIWSLSIYAYKSKGDNNYTTSKPENDVMILHCCAKKSKKAPHSF